MKTYQSVKQKLMRNLLIFVFIFVCGIVGLATWAEPKQNNEGYIAFGILFLVLLLFLSLWYRTNYSIDKNQLITVSGIFKKKINIEQIIEIKKGNIPISGWKFILTWNRKDVLRIIRKKEVLPLYISPKNQEEFIEDLIKTNPNIEVKTSKY